MDRREALKKMAIGGATIAGATAVLSSPAFAFGEPTGLAITVAVVYPAVSSSAKVEFQITPTFGCPSSSSKPDGAGKFSALNTTVTVVAMKKSDGTSADDVSISYQPITGFFGQNQVSARFWITGGAQATKPVPNLVTDFVLIHNNAAGTSHNQAYQVGDKFKLDITGTVRCRHAGKDKTATLTITKFFTKASGNTSSAWVVS